MKFNRVVGAWALVSCSLFAVPIEEARSAPKVVDGVILIDQKGALAGGITSGDGPGFPVTISEPGSYRLAGNLIVSATSGIEIKTDNVTLDLNGFSIVGPGTYLPQPPGWPDITGVLNTVFCKNVTVTNGTIKSFYNGINFTGCAPAHIEKIRVSDNIAAGIVVFYGTIIDNQASDNGVQGIYSLFASTISGNLVLSNGASYPQDGIGIRAGRGSTVSGNTVSENKGTGIWGECPVNMSGNTATQSSSTNLVAYGAGCLLVNNLAP